MSVEHIKGDLLQWPSGINVIAQSCNAQGVMGSGLAKVIRDTYPQVYSDYRAAYEANTLTLGGTLGGGTLNGGTTTISGTTTSGTISFVVNGTNPGVILISGVASGYTLVDGTKTITIGTGSSGGSDDKPNLLLLLL